MGLINQAPTLMGNKDLVLFEFVVDAFAD